MSNIHYLDLEYAQQQKREVERAAESQKSPDNLQFGGGGGTSGGMDTVDAKIGAAEARTDTKFAELRGDLKDFATKTTVWQAVGTIIVSILGVLLAVIAFGGDRFDAGMGIADVRQAQIDRDAKQDAAVKDITGKLDRLIAAQEKNQPTDK